MSPSTATLFTASLLATLVASNPAADSLNPRAMAARPKFGNVPYGKQITSCVAPNMIALTFDDGPGMFTDHVLDLFQKAGNIKATFYLNGNNGGSGNGMVNSSLTPVLKRMLASGHQLASHSFSHADFGKISEADQTKELVQNEEVFANLLGVVPTYFRPPFTSCDATCLATASKLGYHVTDYDLDTKDFEGFLQPSKDKFTAAIAQAPKSWIVLSHDIHALTANSLTPFMIDQARAKGYKFVTVGECLGDPQENWYRNPVTGNPIGGGTNNNVKPPVVTTTMTTTIPYRTTAASSSTSSSSAGLTTTSNTTSITNKNSEVAAELAASSPTTTAPTPVSTTPAPTGGAVGRTSVGAFFGSVFVGGAALALLV